MIINLPETEMRPAETSVPEYALDGPMHVPDIPAAEIHFALTRILASAMFMKAQRMSRLLRFLVEKRLVDAVRDTNEYTIGLGVFDRDPATYNTGEDPIVRVQIGRLREKLKAYYATLGRKADLTFSIPIGNYMPVIRRVDAGEANFERRHLLAMQPLNCLSVDPVSTNFTQGLSEELAFQLFREFGNKIVSHTFAVTNIPSGSDLSSPSASRGVSHRFEGSIRVEGKLIRASFRLVDAVVGSIAWSEQFDRHNSLAISLQEELAFSICEALKYYFSHG